MPAYQECSEKEAVHYMSVAQEHKQTCRPCFCQETFGWLRGEAQDFLAQRCVKLILWRLARRLCLTLPLLFKHEVEWLRLGAAGSQCRFLSTK